MTRVGPDDVARRRRTVSWVAAAAATAAVAAGVALVGTAGGTSPAPVTQPLRGAVPWIDQPAPPYRPPPTPRRAPPATGARPCQAGDVAARFTPRGNGAGGHLLVLVRFRNVSGTTCVLKGYPARVVASEPGHPDVTARNGSFFGNDPAANIAAGRTAFLGLETDTECPARPGGGPAGPPYHHVQVGLPGGGTVAVVRRADPLDVTCGLRTTTFFVPQPTRPEPHDPLADLQAALRLPRTTRAGTTMRYGVTLTNPTDRPISLDRCPGYLEATSAERLQSKLTYALNCEPVGAIQPQQTVLFEMRVPSPSQPGRYRLDWQLLGPSLHSPRALGSFKVVP